MEFQPSTFHSQMAHKNTYTLFLSANSFCDLPNSPRTAFTGPSVVNMAYARPYTMIQLIKCGRVLAVWTSFLKKLLSISWNRMAKIGGMNSRQYLMEE